MARARRATRGATAETAPASHDAQRSTAGHFAIGWDEVGELHHRPVEDLQRSRHLTAVSYGAEGVTVWGGLDGGTLELVNKSITRLERQVAGASLPVTGEGNGGNARDVEGEEGEL